MELIRIPEYSSYETELLKLDKNVDNVQLYQTNDNNLIKTVKNPKIEETTKFHISNWYSLIVGLYKLREKDILYRVVIGGGNHPNMTGQDSWTDVNFILVACFQSESNDVIIPDIYYAKILRCETPFINLNEEQARNTFVSMALPLMEHQFDCLLDLYKTDCVIPTAASY